ncbi:hypothetical protein GN244_ATG12048 [Phytophthora infestans]|uniref:Uncharacterized protein n=1 Tax=Phytophthora infestans TaxID=4787 RepID=A0A833WBC6_PHYIN|nr:hypothetical protein GN244_ATG12048 [Phytophthora infestans]
MERFIAMHFAKHPELMEGQRIVKFGAASENDIRYEGTYRRSLLIILQGAAVACGTPFRCKVACDDRTGRRDVREHLWGSDTAALLKCLDASPSAVLDEQQAFEAPDDSTKLDLKWQLLQSVYGCMACADLKFEDGPFYCWLPKHEDLLKFIDACLSPGGKVRHVLLLFFAHHAPGHEEHDLSFFIEAKKLFGFDAVHLDTLASPHIFNADKIVGQYLHMFSRYK